ncbi:hypothetical protein RRF57_008178 [Xylaria bambusicola]|uniref:Uncharacterized protein n=1 Tax=Xylaria bambusicola TaxID=326684 RepID=A0AAN7Z0G3_9PEZI
MPRYFRSLSFAGGVSGTGLDNVDGGDVIRGVKEPLRGPGYSRLSKSKSAVIAKTAITENTLMAAVTPLDSLDESVLAEMGEPVRIELPGTTRVGGSETEIPGARLAVRLGVTVCNEVESVDRVMAIGAVKGSTSKVWGGRLVLIVGVAEDVQ